MLEALNATCRMLLATCVDISAACWIFRAISLVALPCASIAAAILEPICEILPILLPISVMALTDSSVAAWISAICCAISEVALAVCVASDFTSCATTAKPRPALPARAASIVALRAKRFVCLAIAAISSTTPPTFAQLPTGALFVGRFLPPDARRHLRFLRIARLGV